MPMPLLLPSGVGARRRARPGRAMSVKRYAIAAAASVGAALLFSPLSGMLDLANIVMLFLLVVLLVAYTLGRGPSVLATCLSVGCFDFFYVEPRFTFAIADLQYLITFAVMLSVGLITGQLTAGLRFQARVAAQRERRARALYEFARELSGAPQVEQVVETTRAVISRSFDGEASVLLPDADGRLQAPPAQAGMAPDLGVAQWAFDHAAAAGMDTDTLPASACLYLPLVAPMRCRGVLAIAPRQRRWLSSRSSAGSSTPSPRWRPSPWSACITSRWRSRRCSRWSRSACAIPCWRRCRTICARP